MWWVSYWCLWKRNEDLKFICINEEICDFLIIGLVMYILIKCKVYIFNNYIFIYELEIWFFFFKFVINNLGYFGGL